MGSILQRFCARSNPLFSNKLFRNFSFPRNVGIERTIGTNRSRVLRLPCRIDDPQKRGAHQDLQPLSRPRGKIARDPQVARAARRHGWDIKDDDLVCEFIPDFNEEDDDGNEIPKNIRYRWRDEVRDDVLARLLALNAERYQQEVNAGLHAKIKEASKKKASKKAAKKVVKIIDLPRERELDFLATLYLPSWASRIPKFTYPLSSLPRTNAHNGLAYYRALIPAVVQEAGGSLPLNVLFDAICRLEDKDHLLEAAENIPAATKKKWSKSFAEPVDANTFGSALESLCQVGRDIRLIGSRQNLQLRFVKDSPITLDWYLLDAQFILAAEAAAQQREETTREVPTELIDKIMPFATAS
jgi:hypothetical protein